jgi:hypothetical protein
MTPATEQAFKYFSLALKIAREHLKQCKSKAKTESDVEKRRDELLKLKNNELVQLVLDLEKAKTLTSMSDESKAVKAILEDTQCACLTYTTIARLIRDTLDVKITSLNVEMYVFNNKTTWNIQERGFTRVAKL